MFLLEEWKVIEEFPEYEISNYGRVRSHKWKQEKILKPYLKNGYCCVMLSNRVKGQKNQEYTRKGIRVHRLVAKYFSDNYFEECEVHHKDRNRQNNNINNLMCLTKEAHIKLHKELKERQRLNIKNQLLSF